MSIDRNRVDVLLEDSEAVLFVLILALLTYTVIDGDAMAAAFAGFYAGLNSVSATRSLYAVIWRIRHG